jgi:hypothetical protein
MTDAGSSQQAQQSRIAMPQPRTATGGFGDEGSGGTPRSSTDKGDPRVVNGVLTSPGPPTGTTSMYGPSSGSLGYPYPSSGEADASRRGSEDRPQQTRSNANSVNHSPASIASSSRHIIHGGEPAGSAGTLLRGNGGGTGNLWPGSAGSNGPSTTSKLPRITTSVADNEEAGAEGPRSAPVVSGPLRPPSAAGAGPMRSSTSPDPYTASSNSERGSPIDRRPPPLLGHTFYPAPSLKFPTPQLPAPPRRSSHQNHQSTYGQPAPPIALDRPDRPLGSQSSHHSLSGSNLAGDHVVASGGDSSRDKDKDLRSGRSRDPTYCGQCNQVVHGQFVRAMGKVYHLNCFRCKVSSCLCNRARAI